MRKKRTLVRFCIAAITVGMVLVLAGCAAGGGGGTATTTTGTTGAGGVKIALLLPESKTARY